MTTESAENRAVLFDGMLLAQRANRAETARAEVDGDDRAAAALAAGILDNGSAPSTTDDSA